MTRSAIPLMFVALAGCGAPSVATMTRERAEAGGAQATEDPAELAATPSDGCAMTGGGWLLTGDGQRVSQGYALHDPSGEGPARLQVSWGRGHRFQLETLETARCVDDPTVAGTGAPYDTYVGTGVGRLDGSEGSVFFTFTDGGDRAIDDLADLVIYDADGRVVLDVSDRLVGGSHRSL